MESSCSVGRARLRRADPRIVRRLRRASPYQLAALCILISLCVRVSAQSEAKPPDKLATVFGARIHYVDTGTGSPVILLHGLGDDVGVWESVIPALSAKHRVIAVDQIGFGRSEKLLLSYHAATFVDFLDGFFNELKIDRASIVGNSLGGWIAAVFAILHPERVDHLVLSDAAGYAALAKTMSPRTLSALRLSSRDDIRYLGPLTFRDKRFYADVDGAFQQRVSAGDGYTVDQVVSSIIRGDDVLDGRLGAIHQPTLIIWGHDDKLIPVSFGERFHKEIAGSELRIIGDCGHMPQVECPDQFAGIIGKFLDEQK